MRLSLAIFALFSVLCWVRCAVDPGDGKVIQALAKAIEAETALGWDPSVDPCSWNGVTCAGTRIVGIHLQGKTLSGTLPSNLNQLSQLTSLFIQNNHLSGSLPTLAGMSSLKSVFVYNNKFSSIPNDFFKGLTSLQVIAIDSNPFEPWAVPPDLIDSSRLVNFTATATGLTGPIPSFFGDKFTNLSTLSLALNNLSGPIPTSFASSNMAVLWLNGQTGKTLSGNINVIAGMASLVQVRLHNNAFTGAIPDLSELVFLKDIKLSSNKFTGPLPQSLMSLPSLTNVSLFGNLLQGPYPSFAKSVAAEVGDVNTNSFCLQQPGPCDRRVDTLLQFASDLGYPYVLASKWKGNNPCNSWMYVSCSVDGDISVLNMGSLQLSGTLSPALANFSKLSMVILDNNNLTGTIPTELTKLQKLTKLYLRNNNLSGKIPPFAPTVQVLVDGNPNIGKNVAPTPSVSPSTLGAPGGSSTSSDSPGMEGKGGSTPPLSVSSSNGAAIASSSSVPWLLVSSFNGVAIVSSSLSVPSSNGVPYLWVPPLSVPSSFNGVPYLSIPPSSLPSSSNGVSYLTVPPSSVPSSSSSSNGVPSSSSSNGVPYLTVPPSSVPSSSSSNRAAIATAPSSRPSSYRAAHHVIATAPSSRPSSYRAAHHVRVIATAPSSRSSNGAAGVAIATAPSSRPSSNGAAIAPSSRSSSNVAAIAGGAVGAFVGLALIGCSCFCCLKMRKKFGNVQSTDTLEFNPPATTKETENMVFPMQVLCTATNNFSEQNVLGRGGFGVVYKGELHDGTQIAVKRMESGMMSSKGLNEFHAEIAVLTKVRHRNLVALLGYCTEGNERLIVLECMSQGPLSHHLFEWESRNLKPLDWTKRFAIALDVARGVEYLHSLAQKSFIHRDLKPSNILLGDDMRAKVSDFGLVRAVPDGKFSVDTRLAGTFGYLAPEYAITGRVTTKVDMFSYGVVLMELITGRKALDYSQSEESMYLVTWFSRMDMQKENFINVLDQNMDVTEETFKSICTVAELAGHCTADEPRQRPDMGHAVNVTWDMLLMFYYLLLSSGSPLQLMTMKSSE